MKKLVLVFLLVFSQHISAQVTGASKYRCTSNNFGGDSVTEAIANCQRLSNFNADTCARNVNCLEYRTHCVAQNYSGDNVKEAVARCAHFTRFDESTCLRNVNCR